MLDVGQVTAEIRRYKAESQQRRSERSTGLPEQPLAGFGLRLAAHLIDYLIVSFAVNLARTATR